VTLTKGFIMGKSILGISDMITPGIGCLITSGDSYDNLQAKSTIIVQLGYST
jgi:hypothetical protein